MEGQFEKIVHPFVPVFNSESKILILGSLPSIKSRENGFYYGHPQNRFWRLLSAIFDETPPISIEQKIEFLLCHNIALWDVVYSCEISGSADSAIRNAVPNDIEKIFRAAKIKKVCANGGTAFCLYKKFFDETFKRKYGTEIFKLPSTSPANAAWNLEKLVNAWKEVLL